MFGGVSDHQDPSSTYHRIGQLSAVLKSPKWHWTKCQEALIRPELCHWCFELTLSEPERNKHSLKQHSQSRLHWRETCTTCQTGMCFPRFPGSLKQDRFCVSKSNTFTECVCDPSVFFPLFQLPEIVSNDVATKFRLPGSLSHSLEESYLEALLSIRAFCFVKPLGYWGLFVTAS